MKPENLKCPNCGGPMVSRLNKANQSRFWGCQAFPACKGTRDNMGRSRDDKEEENWHQGNLDDLNRFDRKR